MAKRAKAKATKKKQEEEVSPDWERLPLLDKLVDELVANHHPHLQRAKIVVLGKPRAGRRGESVVIATAQRAPKNLQALYKDASGADLHYLIVLGRDRWESLRADQKKIEIDRALCAFSGLDDKGKWGIALPDVVEYREIVKRYGDKLPELHGVLRVVRQMSMFSAEAEKKDGETA